MAIQLDGPRIAPRGGSPDALIVLLHGYGANGDDLIGFDHGGELGRRKTHNCRLRVDGDLTIRRNLHRVGHCRAVTLHKSEEDAGSR